MDGAATGGIGRQAVVKLSQTYNYPVIPNY
jgi:hypothetical protein